MNANAAVVAQSLNLSMRYYISVGSLVLSVVVPTTLVAPLGSYAAVVVGALIGLSFVQMTFEGPKKVIMIQYYYLGALFVIFVAFQWQLRTLRLQNQELIRKWSV